RAVDAADQIVDQFVGRGDVPAGEGAAQHGGEDHVVGGLYPHGADGVQARAQVRQVGGPRSRRIAGHQQQGAAARLGQVDQVEQALVVGVLGPVQQDGAALQLQRVDQ